MKTNTKRGLIIILAIITVILVQINPEAVQSIREWFGTDGIVSIILVIFYCLLFNSIKDIKDKRASIISFILAIIFSSIQIIGYSINKYLNLDGVIGSKMIFLKSILQFIAYTITFYSIILLLYKKAFVKLKESKNNIEKKWFTNNKRSFFICALIIFIAYLPYFLHFYPGIFTTDSITEMNAGIGSMNELINHHPVTHILVISICLNIGNLISNYTLGIAIYSVFQMILSAIIFSYVIKYMAKKGINFWIRIITLLFFALYPPFAAYSITMWKDVPFALFMLLFVIQIVEMVTNKEYFSKKRNIVIFTILSILLILFRNNGVYVVLISLFIMLLMMKYCRKNILIILSCVIAFYIIFKGPIFSFFNITDGPVKEALSVPLQQIARTVKYRESELTQEEKNSIYKYLPVEDLGEKYYPLISDSVKEKFNNEEFKENKLEFVSTWLKLLVKYPREYVEAFLDNSYGYWYPGAINWVIVDWEEDTLNDIIDFEEKPLLKIGVIDKLVEYINQRKIPVLSMTVNIGFTFWVVLICLGYVVYKKKYKMILVYVPILALWLTTIASPVWCEYRYIYSMFTCIPILTYLAIVIANKKDDEKIEG